MRELACRYGDYRRSILPCTVFPGDGCQIWERVEISPAAVTKWVGSIVTPIQPKIIDQTWP